MITITTQPFLLSGRIMTHEYNQLTLALSCKMDMWGRACASQSLRYGLLYRGKLWQWENLVNALY